MTDPDDRRKRQEQDVIVGLGVAALMSVAALFVFALPDLPALFEVWFG